MFESKFMQIIKFALDSVAFSCFFSWFDGLKSAWISAVFGRQHSDGCFAPSFNQIGHNVQKLHSYQWSEITKQNLKYYFFFIIYNAFRSILRISASLKTATLDLTCSQYGLPWFLLQCKLVSKKWENLKIDQDFLKSTRTYFGKFDS